VSRDPLLIRPFLSCPIANCHPFRASWATRCVIRGLPIGPRKPKEAFVGRWSNCRISGRFFPGGGTKANSCVLRKQCRAVDLAA